MGSVSYFLGHLARCLGRVDDAERHFSDALTMNERMGFVPQVARTKVALARVLADRGGRSGSPHARVLLGEASDTAQRLGMAPLLVEIEGFRGRIVSTPAQSRTH
jgi:hypothetical protein